jgi:hypothetical protein
MKLTKETLKYKETDHECITGTLEDFEIINNKEMTITAFNGALLSIKIIPNFQPKIGMVVKFYGEPFQSVRGVEIDGHISYYRTPEQEERKFQKWLKQNTKEKKLSYKKHKKQLDKDYNSLPKVFQLRMNRLRKKDSKTRYEWEAYEMFVLKEAVKIAKAFKTKDDLKSWWNKDLFGKVPDLDEGHSGNTYGAAKQLAYRYLDGMEL